MILFGRTLTGTLAAAVLAVATQPREKIRPFGLPDGAGPHGVSPAATGRLMLIRTE